MPPFLLLALGGCGASHRPEVAVDAGPAGPPFADVTAESGIDFARTTRDDLLSLADTMGGGVCLFDLDGDGDLDVLFTDRARARLYRQSDGVFVDDSSSLPGALADSMGCAVGDWDADGDPDLYVTAIGEDALLRNDGGRLVDVTAAVGISAPDFGSSAAFADFDGDHDLDLFVGQFLSTEVAHPDACAPLPCDLSLLASDPLPNLLFSNEGGSFREAAAEHGLAQADPTLAVAAFDFEEDGDLDLFVANDLGATYPDRLYLNDGTGTFADEAPAHRVDRDATGYGGDGMGVAVADGDRDGRQEIAVTNFQYFQVTYFDCDETFFCPDRGFDVGLAPTRDFLSWGVLLEDFDGDGWTDLFVSNGHVYPTELQAILGRTGPMEMRPQLFWNEDGTFVEQDETGDDALDAPRHGRGVAQGDLDGDGDPDLVQATAAGSPFVLHNETAGRFVRVRPSGRGTDGVGAVVVVTTEDGVQTRQRIGGASYLSASEDVLSFGLGGASSADVEVRFPGGAVVRASDVAAGTTLDVEEP
jgi:hypothetical protein